jgi:cell division protein FtsL
MMYVDYVSNEPLDIIEANECAYRTWQLTTQRFRAVFNALHHAQAELKKLEISRSAWEDSARINRLRAEEAEAALVAARADSDIGL